MKTAENIFFETSFFFLAFHLSNKNYSDAKLPKEEAHIYGVFLLDLAEAGLGN